MNAKTRALLWEELWVGGPIAGALFAVVALIAVVMRLTHGSGLYCWQHQRDMLLFFTLGIPLMTGLLVTLNTANSGHLSGGFSKRILRLPVDTWSTVASILFTRLLLVWGTAAASVGLCRLVFHNGPGLRAVFLIAGVYLFIQLLDWSRGVTLAILPAGLIGAVGFLLVRVGGVERWASTLASDAGVTPAFLAIFLLCGAVAYAVSYALVLQTRCGERLALLSNRDAEEILPWRRAIRKKPFASPVMAQAWYEQRRSGALFPGMVLLTWFMLVLLRWLVVYFSRGRGYPGLDSYLDPMWSLEILPFIALVIAAFAWSLKVNRSEAGKGRPYGFRNRLPLRKEQMAQARLLVAGLNVGVCLALITAISLISFFARDNVFALHVIRYVMDLGGTDLREVTAMMLGVPIAIGLFVWFLMSPQAVKFKWLFAACTACVALEALFLYATHLYETLPVAGVLFMGCVFTVIAYFPVVGAYRLFIAWRRGLMAKSSVAICVVAWGVLAALFFPFESRGAGVLDWLFLVICLAAGGVPAFTYVNAVMAFSRREHEGTAMPENPEQHARVWGRYGAGRLALAACAVAGLSFLAWMRWPMESRWEQMRHAQGLPARVDELNEWYPAVPDNENLANLYVSAAEDHQERTRVWGKAESQSPIIKRRATSDKVLIVGEASLEGDEPIPEDVWAATKRYWENVGHATAEELNAAARSGLTESRYLGDFGDVSGIDLGHLSVLRDLARVLKLEALIASVEGRPEEAITATADIIPLANSLKMEPLIISQLVRVAMLGIAASAAEDSVSRGRLSGEELVQLSEVLSKALPPVAKERILDRAVILEETYIRHKVSPQNLADYAAEKGLSACYWLAPVSEFSNCYGFAQALCTYRFQRTRERAKAAAESGVMVPLESEEDKWLGRAGILGPIVGLYIPAMGNAYESEWRIRTNLDAAVTGIAVERFRLAQGRLPERLEELVPLYLDEVPNDMYNGGRPLSYRVKDDGAFVVYSWGRNQRDDRGLARNEDENTECDDLGFERLSLSMAAKP